jgi:superoxide reductase
MATQKLQVFKCELCGNIVESIHEGPGELVCCGAPMKRFEENTVDAAKEKHVPVVEKIDGGYRVKVGDVAHPMSEDHWIEWIDLIAGGKAYREFLNPGDTPEATFLTDAGDVKVRAYCNLHGLWQA